MTRFCPRNNPIRKFELHQYMLSTPLVMYIRKQQDGHLAEWCYTSVSNFARNSILSDVPYTDLINRLGLLGWIELPYAPVSG